MAKYLDSTGITTLWNKAKNTFAGLSHDHNKITHTFWGYNNAISEDTTPQDICSYFNVPSSSYNAVFTGVVKDSDGRRWQNLYWTNYGGAGLIELGKSYGGGGRLRYRIATGWSDGEKSWLSDGYKYLATTSDLTWGSIENKPFSSGTDSLGVYFEGTSNTGIRMQYNRGSSLGYDQILLKDGVLKFNNQTVYHSGNLNPSSFSLASHNHDTNYAKINAYTLPSQKGVRISYNSYSPVIVNVCGSNSGAQLVIIGTGYGGGGRIRNQFTELVSCSMFDWCIPNSESIACSVEIYSRRDSDSTVTVIGSGYVVFTAIDSLTSTKENATLLNSSNYTSWAASVNHNHSLASLGAASVDHNHDGTYLKLSGGTISGTTASLFTLKSSNNDNYITYKQDETVKGYIGWENGTGMFVQCGSRYIHVTDSGSLKFYDTSSDKDIFHSGNYTDYTVKKDGTGASGTWGINISGSAGSVAWGNISGKPTSFAPSIHYHDFIHGKNFYLQYSGYQGLPSNLTPSQIMSAEGITESNVFAFSAFTDDGTGLKTSFFWGAWGQYGVNEIRSSYGSNSHLQYRVSKSYPNDEWQAYKTLANTEDLTWNNISSKPDTATRWPSWSEVTGKPSTFTPASHTHSYLPLSGGTLTGDITTKSFWSGMDGSGMYIEGNSSAGLRIQYPRMIDGNTRSNYDQLLLKNGTLKFNSNTVYHSGNSNLGSVRWTARSLYVNNYNASGNIGVASVIINKGGDYYGLGNDPGNISNIAIGTTTDSNGTWKNILLTVDGSGNTTISGGLTIGGNTAIHTGNYTSYCATAGHTHSNYSTTSHQHDYIKGYNFYENTSVVGSGHSALPVDWLPHQILNQIISGNTSEPYVFAAFSEPSYKNSLFWTGYGRYGLTELRSGYGGVNTRLQYRVSSGYSNGSNPTWGDFHTLAWTDDIPSAMTSSEIDTIIV